MKTMTEKKYERYYALAGKASFENWESIKKSKMCGCYYCCSIFPSSEITDDDWTPDLHGRTVLCPKCFIDSVIGDASGIPICEDVLEELHQEKFGIPAEPVARCVGSGIYNLDTIVVRDYPDGPTGKRFTDKVVAEEVGGTCGNVMCLLSNFGLETYPQVSLDDSPEGRKIAEDLERYDCDMRFVTNTQDGGTTRLRVTHKRNPDGSPKVSVRAGSPGGSRFPRRKFLRARDQAPAFVDALTSQFIPDFYFIDSPAAGHRYIARELRTMGTQSISSRQASRRRPTWKVCLSATLSSSLTRMCLTFHSRMLSKTSCSSRPVAKTGYASNYGVVNGRRSRAYLTTISLTRKAPGTGLQQPLSTELFELGSLLPS